MASRRRRRESRALDAPGVAGEPQPLPGLRAVVRRPAFRASAVRQVLPVIGVFFLRWPALDIVAFFLLEVWMFLTLRAAFELTFDRDEADERALDTTRMRVVFARLLVVALAGMFIGLAQAFGWGGQLLVLVISGAIVWLEAAPERAEALLGFTPRTS